MTVFYAFNGDADGLCALQQLRLAHARDAILVTGVKRDIRLLQRIRAIAGDEVIALDISLDQNRDDLLRLLGAGARVRYFDHHYTGVMPQHPNFEPYIEEGADVCTSMLVDRQLGGRYRSWAIVAAFGDNLPELGTAMASAASIDPAILETLARLGTSLNYNAYGNSVSDLCFDPAELAREMLPYADPVTFVRDCPAHGRLIAQFETDMQEARRLQPYREVPGARILVLPDQAWARRAIGVLANELAHAYPGSAIAILAPKVEGGFTVSVRSPVQSATTAEQFCRGFASGGGRKAAAGINHLPSDEIDEFVSSFEASFGMANRVARSN